MQVETFECCETAAEPIEASEEAIRIISELGLEGQQSMVRSAPGDRQTRCPYREMEKDEHFVYKMLCPDSAPVERYNRSPIPLRVLQVVAHAKSLDFFKKIVVWDRATAVVKDPVLVGVAPEPDNQWRERFFILARWGEALDEFPAMLRKALASKRVALKSRYESIAQQAQAGAACIDTMDDATLLATDPTSLPELNNDIRRF